MKRITYWILSTISALVLLFGYRTSTSGSMGGGTATSLAGNAGATDTGFSSSSSLNAAAATGTASSFTGNVASTRWGPVQVQITVQDGNITDVTVPEYPTSSRQDQQINSSALPVLIKETISAQSAKIDMVSGATVTSQGYLQSLQSALDEAGL